MWLRPRNNSASPGNACVRDSEPPWTWWRRKPSWPKPWTGKATPGRLIGSPKWAWPMPLEKWRAFSTPQRKQNEKKPLSFPSPPPSLVFPHLGKCRLSKITGDEILWNLGIHRTWGGASSYGTSGFDDGGGRRRGQKRPAYRDTGALRANEAGLRPHGATLSSGRSQPTGRGAG